MSRECSWVVILVSVATLVVAESLPGENPQRHPATLPGTEVGGAASPAAKFDESPIDVVNISPFILPQSTVAKPYAETSPVEPWATSPKAAKTDSLPETSTGVLKYRLYLDKEPSAPLPLGVGGESNVIPAAEMPSNAPEAAKSRFANPYLVSSGSIDALVPDQGWLWQRLIDSLAAPAGAFVTNLEYSLRIDDNGDEGSFYCGDYEIYLFSGDPDRELLVYDKLGGRTDGGFDDDSEDDSDIHLNWRATHFFDGDDARDWFGVWIDDVYTYDEGILNYIEFYVHWAVPLPNLTCYQPSGWDSAIVVSSVTGTHTADSLTGGEPAFIDWAVINDGGADVVGRFNTALYIDNTYVTQWYTDDLGMNWWAWVSDYLQILDSGVHEICIAADFTGLIAEEDEQDNACCYNYYWYPKFNPPELHCYSPGWDGPIVVSAVPGTSTQDEIRVCDTAWVDWAVGNSGGSPTANRYYVWLLVDDVPIQVWYQDPPHTNGYYIWVSDYPFLFETPGPHLVALEIDFTEAVAEADEANNYCEVVTFVVGCQDPDIICFQPDGWDGSIVVSGVPGTTTHSTVFPGENAYIDFALANDGLTPTAVNFYSTLYVDGDSIMTWYSTPLAPGDWRLVSDFVHVFSSLGPHVVSVLHDATDVIVESNEANNWCEHEVVVGGWPCGDADGSGGINLADALHLLAYLFGQGGPPLDVGKGDYNCDGRLNISDVVYTVAYIFGAGLPPCAEC